MSSFFLMIVIEKTYLVYIYHFILLVDIFWQIAMIVCCLQFLVERYYLGQKNLPVFQIKYTIILHCGTISHSVCDQHSSTTWIKIPYLQQQFLIVLTSSLLCVCVIQYVRTSLYVYRLRYKIACHRVQSCYKILDINMNVKKYFTEVEIGISTYFYKDYS